MAILNSSPLTLDSSRQRRVDSSKLSEIARLCGELKLSLRRPTRRTLTLINKALSFLSPFESPSARATSASEKRDLLDLINIHRLVLCPYLDLDRIEWNLRLNN